MNDTSISARVLHQAPGIQDYNELREEYLDRMMKEGYTILYPGSNELFLDIDSDAQLTTFWEVYKNLQRNLLPGEVVTHSFKASETRGHFHITITLPWPVDTWQRIAWQAALGSDPIRELLSAFRAHRGDEAPTLFVEKASTAG